MTGIAHPQEFTGLIGFGGRLDTAFVNSSGWDDASGLSAFVANGTMDQGASVEAGLEAFAILEDLGIEAVFSSWEGVHMVNRPVLLQAQEWMETLR